MVPSLAFLCIFKATLQKENGRLVVHQPAVLIEISYRFEATKSQLMRLAKKVSRYFGRALRKSM